jgi:chromosome segregation ATPase
MSDKPVIERIEFGSLCAERDIVTDFKALERIAIANGYHSHIAPWAAEIEHLRAQVAELESAHTKAHADEAEHAAKQSNEIAALRYALEESDKRVTELERALGEHNAGVDASCEAQRERRRCDPYLERGRECPECPRDWRITLEQSAGQK